MVRSTLTAVVTAPTIAMWLWSFWLRTGNDWCPQTIADLFGPHTSWREIGLSLNISFLLHPFPVSRPAKKFGRSPPVTATREVCLSTTSVKNLKNYFGNKNYPRRHLILLVSANRIDWHNYGKLNFDPDNIDRWSLTTVQTTTLRVSIASIIVHVFVQDDRIRVIPPGVSTVIDTAPQRVIVVLTPVLSVRETSSRNGCGTVKRHRVFVHIHWYNHRLRRLLGSGFPFSTDPCLISSSLPANGLKTL